MNKYFLGVDGGGTSTLTYLADGQGRIIAEAKSGPSNYHVVGRKQALLAINNSIMDVYRKANLDPEKDKIETACFGLAGIDTEKDYQNIYPYLKEIGYIKNTILLNDAYLALAAGNQAAEGIALIAGTGSIAVGISDKGQRKRVGGWGHIFDDKGSGYNIAVNAIEAIFREYDGRGEKTLLSGLFAEELVLDSTEDLIEEVYVQQMSRKDIANLARLVFEAADAGDMAAINIIWQAGLDLSELVYTVIKELDIKKERVVLPLFGGVFKSKNKILFKIIKNELKDRLSISRKVKDVQLIKAELEAPAGALLLAYDSAEIKEDSEILENLKRGIYYVEKNIS